MATRFDSQQVFTQQGGANVTVDRHETLVETSWHTWLQRFFIVALVLITLVVVFSSYKAGSAWGSHSSSPAYTPSQPIVIQPPAPPAFPSSIDVNMKGQVNATIKEATPTCEDVCRRNNTGQAARFCIVTRCRP